jgi:hypothetical protein
MDICIAAPSSIHWSHTPDGILVLRYSRFWPSAVDFARVWDEVEARSTFNEDVPLLVDLRQVRGDESAGTVRRFVAGLPALARRIPQRRAYLVARPVQYGLARMIQSHAAPLRLESRIFERWDDAVDWLRRLDGAAGPA